MQAAGRRAGEGGMVIVGRGFDPTDPIVAGRFVKAYIDWEDRLAGILAERSAPSAPTWTLSRSGSAPPSRRMRRCPR